jgi:mono/diheme cytochrome c family protein
MEYLRRVIGRGIPGTAMPAFRFRMQPAEIEQLSAYVFAISRGEAVEEESDAPAPSAPKEAPAGPAASPALGRGDAAAGKELFFSATVIENCRVCHTFQGRGGKVGPDLTPLAVRTPRELYRSIVEPSSVINPAAAG